MDSKRKILQKRSFGYKKQKPVSYLIIVDTEQTEYNYFNGLKDSIPEKYKNRIDIKIINTNTKSLVDFCVKQKLNNPNLVISWIVFDRDRVKNFDQIITKAYNNKISVAWSNPCIEYWFFSYYGKMPKLTESTQCVAKFSTKFKEKTGKEYKKNNKHIYSILNKTGSQNNAIIYNKIKYYSYIKQKLRPSQMHSCSTIFQLIDDLIKDIQSIE